MVGRTRPLPRWTQRNGILVGIRGGTTGVQHVCRNLFKYKCPLAGVLIKDWTGVKSTSNANSCGNNPSWYNYVLEREHYTGWQPLVDSLERRGISVGLYISPYLEEIPMVLRSGRRYLFGEAGNEYFVKKRAIGNKKKDDAGAGDGGALYNHFKKTKCGILDATNYNARHWFKQVIKNEVLEYASASFWLADTSMGGPPMDGVYTCHPNNGLSYHHSYAEDWAKLNREAINEAGRDGDSFFIMNSAYGSSTKDLGCTSLEDHVTSFHHDNGDVLRSILNGIINGGFSGLTHGHCAVNVAVPRQIKSALGNTIDSKSREMICRWFEMTAFTTLFRTHDGGESGTNDASGGSAKSNHGNMLCAYEDEVVMKSLARWSRVYVALSDYRLSLINEASFRGYPVVRHPVLLFPNDEHFSRMRDKKESGKDSYGASSQAFMLGDLIYVVPVLKSGVVKSKVYLPEGGWIHLWVSVDSIDSILGNSFCMLMATQPFLFHHYLFSQTLEEVAGPHNIGKTIEVSAPLGEPPVFVRDCEVMHQFVDILKQKRIITMKKKSRKKSMFSFRRKKE